MKFFRIRIIMCADPKLCLSNLLLDLILVLKVKKQKIRYLPDMSSLPKEKKLRW